MLQCVWTGRFPSRSDNGGRPTTPLGHQGSTDAAAAGPNRRPPFSANPGPNSRGKPHSGRGKANKGDGLATTWDWSRNCPASSSRAAPPTPGSLAQATSPHRAALTALPSSPGATLSMPGPKQTLPSAAAQTAAASPCAPSPLPQVAGAPRNLTYQALALVARPTRQPSTCNTPAALHGMHG